MVQLPETGFLRLDDIIGNPSKGIPGFFRVSRSAWYAGVAAGRFPKPVKLGPRTAGYPAEKLRSLIQSFQAESAETVGA
jgi:prophage regulatory protein